jgi:hypothetical protein
MKTIFWESLSGGCCVSVDETTDADYARQCFDGADCEWLDVLADCDATTPMFYIVSSGLSGCYMRDNVSVLGCKEDALNMAKDELERDTEESEEWDEPADGS